MQITVEYGANYDRAHGEVSKYKYVESIHVEANGASKTIERRSVGDFRHKETGCLLTVESDVFHNEPNITVETASSELDEHGYRQWNDGRGENGEFTAFTALEQWLSANAELVTDQ